MFWTKIALIGVIFTPVVFLQIVYILCNIKKRFFLFTIYFITGFFGVTDVTDTLNTKLQLIDGYLYYPLVNGWLYPLLCFGWIVTTAYGSYKLFGVYRNSRV